MRRKTFLSRIKKMCFRSRHAEMNQLNLPASGHFKLRFALHQSSDQSAQGDGCSNQASVQYMFRFFLRCLFALLIALLIALLSSRISKQIAICMQGSANRTGEAFPQSK